MSPPIRGVGTSSALKKALAGGILQVFQHNGSYLKVIESFPVAAGTAIDCLVVQVVATDHAVFNKSQKRRGRDDFRQIPNGVNGIEERLHVAWEELVNSGGSCGHATRAPLFQP